MTESLFSTEHQVKEVYQKGISRIETWDNGIVYIKIEDGVEIQLEDSEIQYNYLHDRYDGINKYLILVDPGQHTSITKEAREFSNKPEKNEMTKATAVVVKSLAHRLIINFIIKFIHQQTMKMRMFDDREKAIQWLLSFKD